MNYYLVEAVNRKFRKLHSNNLNLKAYLMFIARILVVNF